MASMHPPSPCWIGRLHRPKARAKAGTKGGPFYFWKLVIVSGELYVVKSNVICVPPVIYVYIIISICFYYMHMCYVGVSIAYTMYILKVQESCKDKPRIRSVALHIVKRANWELNVSYTWKPSSLSNSPPSSFLFLLLNLVYIWMLIIL